jgi:hypothetical protein
MDYVLLFNVLKKNIRDKDMCYNTYLVITGGRRGFLVEYANYIGHDPEREKMLDEFNRFMSNPTTLKKYKLRYEIEYDDLSYPRKMLFLNTSANDELFIQLREIDNGEEHERIIGQFLGFHCDYRPNVDEVKKVVQYVIDDVNIMTEMCSIDKYSISHTSNILRKMNNFLKHIGKIAVLKTYEQVSQQFIGELIKDIHFVISNDKQIMDGMFEQFTQHKVDIADSVLLIAQLANILENVDNKMQLEFVFRKYGNLILFTYELGNSNFKENIQTECNMNITKTHELIYNPFNNAFNAILDMQ